MHTRGSLAAWEVSVLSRRADVCVRADFVLLLRTRVLRHGVPYWTWNLEGLCGWTLA